MSFSLARGASSPHDISGQALRFCMGWAVEAQHVLDGVLLGFKLLPLLGKQLAAAGHCVAVQRTLMGAPVDCQNSGYVSVHRALG